MSIPPFPSQDLAKLVLGYLAEEQLMTAYDEFLQASPYLDALRNEYDRIFMTSLKSILAEYRAVKIYVDTCKPFVLRKKIFQCTNLLEVVSFLIANVDIKKLQQQEANEKASLDKLNITVTPKPNVCELCHSLSLPNCVCKNKTDAQASYAGTSTLQNSVEATALADLPGNHVTTRKKHAKILEKDGTFLNSNVSSVQNTDSSAKQSFSSNISPEEYLARCENSPVLKSSESSLSLSTTVKPIDPLKAKQNIEEFNNVLKSVVNRNKTLSSSESTSNERISNAGTFQDFASGVSGGETHTATYNVPDSSTSENSNVRVPIRKDVYNDNIKGPPGTACQLMLQVSHVNDSIKIKTCKPNKLPKLLPKSLENQIKIISDVKVDNKSSDKIIKKKPLVPNATSTPLMQMQTIMINGTAAYKHTSNSHTFTKDEIMAMPTLIVVPASGPSQVPTSAHCNPIMTPNTTVMSDANTSPQILGPLVIDVPPNKPAMEALPDLNVQKSIPGDLIKTVDVKTSNATTVSVPKDNGTSIVINTPQVLPPARKSSSTPRRNSHIRVLDFTTPRRILHETINEQVPCESSVPPVEIVMSGSNSTAVPTTTTTESETMDVKSKVTVVKEAINDSGSTKENEATKKTKQAKKYDWDADLRALVANEKPSNVSHRKPKPKTSKKKKSSDKASASKEPETKKKTRSKQSPRVKKSTTRNVENLDDESPPNTDKTCEVPCKPTIKIICGDKVTDIQESKADSSSIKNKLHEKSDEHIETPEIERLSLQNVIGAKLNISDFLETPYKQALYDIQMETPRFLGPDLPDEPLSDIKIMNIPTPRFLNTPNPPQATPSYSSRPTDYSSGGSYYKPDDQDYMPIPDLTTCPVTSSKEDISVEKSVEKYNDEKKSRPVRKCAKNVSYYKNSGAVKKDVEDNIDANSSGSDSVSVNDSFECKNTNETTILKTPRAKAQSTSRTDSRKKSSISKKRKAPKDSSGKDKTKSFMKIKPKYTPKKSSPARNGKRIAQSPHLRGYSNVPQRKRTTSKDGPVNTTSLIVPAATKSRRKSSTPRKLDCTKSFISEGCGHDSQDNISNNKPNMNSEKSNIHDSDTEQIALHWSDEGSEDGKAKDVPTKPIPKETEYITQIQEFIVSTGGNKCDQINDGALQRDLMKRGFDLETAKIIERDLLEDTPLRTDASKSRMLPISIDVVGTKKEDSSLDKTVELNTSVTNELQLVQGESDDDEIELSVHECNEESNNYFVFKHDYTKEVSQEPPIKIKDNFTMEICIDDVTMTLKAPPFCLVLDQDPLTVDEIDYSYKETQEAVDSISGMDKLYTPLKDSFKSQCYEIFDSTLTSIDTPLKAPSPVKNASDASVAEIVLEEEKTELKDNTESKKRKRARSSSNDSANSGKRTKPDADLLLKAANIQNIDIETVLTKLHGH